MGVTTTPILHIIDTEANLKGASGLGAGQIGFASDTKRFIANVGGVFWAFAPEYVGLTLQDVNGATINAVGEFQGDGGALTGIVGENITCLTSITGLSNSNLSLALAELKSLVDSFVSGLYSSLQFDVAATPIATAPGLLQWNATDKTLDLGLNGGSVLQLGQESLVYVYNNTGSSIPNGSAVYISGSSGTRVTIALADADLSSGDKTIGITTQVIADGNYGYITTSGLVRDIDTNAYTEGDTLYLSSTAGELTATAPAKPAHQVRVGTVVKKSAGAGILFVSVHAVSDLAQLCDVSFTGLETGHVPSYDAATGLWKNGGPVKGTTATFTTGPVYVQYDDSTAYSATVAAVRPTHTVGAYSINTKAQDGTAAYSIVRATSSGGSVNACSFGITSASAYADSFAWWGFNDSATTWKERMRLTNGGDLSLARIKLTPEGGYAVKYTAGENLVAGELVTVSSAADDSVIKAPADSFSPIGAVYAAASSGQPVWIVVSGRAQVLLQDSTAATRGYWARTSITVAGRADITNASPPGGTVAALEIHAHEIGHCIESVTAGTNKLAWITMHFN